MPLLHVLHLIHLYSSWLDWLALAQEIAFALVQFLLQVLAITVGALAESLGSTLPPAPEYQVERVQNPCACPHCAAAAGSHLREVTSLPPEYYRQSYADFLARTLAAEAAADLAAASSDATTNASNASVSDAATPRFSRQSGPYFARPTARTLAVEAVQAAQAAEAPINGPTFNPAVGGPLLPDLNSD